MDLELIYDYWGEPLIIGSMAYEITILCGDNIKW